MNREGSFLILSEEEKHKIEYILGLEKRMEKIISIVPSEKELENDPFEIDDTFIEYWQSWSEVSTSLGRLLIDSKDYLEILNNCYNKVLKTEKQCREIIYTRDSIYRE